MIELIPAEPERFRTTSFLAPALANPSRAPRPSYATARDGAAMSLHDKFDIRPPASARPSLVWSTHNLAAQCANPTCSKELLYLREGRLELLELETHAGDPFPSEDG